jgi:hypothetical protein
MIGDAKSSTSASAQQPPASSYHTPSFLSNGHGPSLALPQHPHIEHRVAPDGIGVSRSGDHESREQKGEEENAEGKGEGKEEDMMLKWIQCDKCKEWYHSECILTGSNKDVATIPKKVMAHLATMSSEDKENINWGDWVDKWCDSTIHSKNALVSRADEYPLGFALHV